MSPMICPSNYSPISSKVATLHPESAPLASLRRAKRILRGNVWVLGLGLALAAAPASARSIFAPFAPAPTKPIFIRHKTGRGGLDHARKEPFAGIPKGPMQAIISIREQRLHFYRDGEHIADVPVATGVPGHLTPLGVFSVIQRDRYHHSNIYSNAPMPYMERITWSGVAMHEGPGVGHQASHGCIRMPHNFAAELWGLPTMGMRVIIAGPELRPVDFADPHLFVHKDKPAPTALAKPVETAQTGTGMKTDAADAVQPAGLPPAQTQTPASSGTSTLGRAAEPSGAAPAEAAKTADPIAAPPAPESAKPAEQAKSPQPLRGAVGDAANAAAPADITAPIALDDVPLPLVKPGRIAKADDGPIAIFISRKLGKIFVRQNFMPLLQAPVKIENPAEPLGTHVFTALDYLPDHSTLRWNVVSLPGEAARPVVHYKYVRTYYGELRRERVVERVEPAMPTETPAQALDRIGIPQDVIDQISQLIVPGSSLVVSDHGLGPETGSGTDFIVVTR